MFDADNTARARGDAINPSIETTRVAADLEGFFLIFGVMAAITDWQLLEVQCERFLDQNMYQCFNC